ncbi:MAG: hypothetical protein A2V81_02000 [Candidatus Abawacabacteria bacterium RBG_16_42_10]|uniref:Tryptophan synthase beta chain-like PALP domain-containing protein n=1 Tax=Candidatus Abawacabacteria bacterium RBG_16_42_10 TaxID=1817814 RepID=A0A1F4XKS1_9BACT|nr:MAG: hypothetical protein A2V81_02000 [Candidatus Abawacabacteria bacterium RBG_16_42_10]
MQTGTLKVIKDRFDIWRYADFFPQIPEQFWISDGRKEFTRLEKRNADLFIKHEDEHPLGSHKGRSLAYQLSQLFASGEKKLTISSSGNAAYAFLRLTYSAHSYAFVSPSADKNKLTTLLSLKTKGKIIVSESPRTFANWLVNKHGYIDLRPSQSDDAIVGLMSLGFELFEQIPDLSDDYGVFSVTTSGGNILGMTKAFKNLQEKGLLKTLPKLFPILLQDYKGGTLTTERRQELEKAVSEMDGKIITMRPILKGQENTSFEGNTALRAYEECKIQNVKCKIDKAVVIFTGRECLKQAIPEYKVYSSISDFAKDFKL